MPRRFPGPEPVVFAHRGAHGPERGQNSLSAIERALEIGAAGVEIDVCSLGDGELVAAHDDWIRYRDCKVAFRDLLLTDLHRISGREVLRIEAALQLFSYGDAMLCLDWKGAGDITAVGRLVVRYLPTDTTVVNSSEPAAVAGLKGRYRGPAAGLSLNGRGPHLHAAGAEADRIVGSVAGCGADAAMLQHRLGSPEVLAALRAVGAAIFLWTAEDPQALESLRKRSPDGIMSDVVEDHRARPGQKPCAHRAVGLAPPQASGRR